MIRIISSFLPLLESGEEYRGCEFSVILEKVLLQKPKDIEALSWGARQF